MPPRSARSALRISAVCGNSGQMRFFASLAKQPNVRRRLETHIKHAQRDDFLNPCARIEHRREERVINTDNQRWSDQLRSAPPESHRIRGTQQVTRSLDREDRQDPPTQLQLVRMLRSTVAKIQHVLRTKVRKIQIADRLPSLCGNEPQQQNERITVALYGVRAGPPYPRKLIGEEATQGTAKRLLRRR